jgi:hypothetical protein
MLIVEYPQIIGQADIFTGRGSVLSALQKDLKKHPDVWALIKSTMAEVRQEPNLDPWIRGEKHGWVGQLKSRKFLFEFRIPPHRSQGVARIYFAYIKGMRDGIVLLSAEYKNKKTEASNAKLKAAGKRYNAGYK